ncbi:SulP family sulfate permease [Rhizomicrobium palustre]|uniref:SulP family sulfate permease n=1 Tax=Rhizomicrobium palustre TaxID=189966 RepID=A0A846MZA2_9PROT|nr:SulP family inorganic anion transporter [Rhizomicrobium palustre]NIK88267.1 SulP family sulfate permease [Rhizomicrobium palustre]
MIFKTTKGADQASLWSAFTPKLITVFQEGYGADRLKADLFAGLTVAIVAMPLSMALAIASGVGPERGLFTAIVAGFFISALGGSRHQIGGPTGAFVVVVYGVVAHHGYDGLVIATIMAGLMLMAAGWAKLGTFIKYIPYPVVTGFTTGIALIIFSSQVGDLLGLTLNHPPADVLERWEAYAAAIGTFHWQALLIAAMTLGLIVGVQLRWPKLPAFLIAIAAIALFCHGLSVPVESIGSRFGGIPRMLPPPHLPVLGFAKIRELFPAALTIALLGGIESLLSAVVADGMTGRRHRSNVELVAQGFANMASAVMGGIPATGAIARTATNIRAGARTPVSGMIHAAAVLAMMLVLAPFVSYIPLAGLAAVLVIVCWNMAEFSAFRAILKGPRGDMALLLITFLLTVLVDLSVAICVGVVLSALFFMHRMAETVALEKSIPLLAADEAEALPDAANRLERRALPHGVEVFRLNGPFFFGAVAQFEEVLYRAGGRPRAIILVLEDVPLIDASGVMILKKFLKAAAGGHTKVVLAGVQPGPQKVLSDMGVSVAQAESLNAALAQFS